MKISLYLLLLVVKLTQAQNYAYSSFGPPTGASDFSVLGIDNASEILVMYRDALQVTRSALRSPDGSTYSPIEVPGAVSVAVRGLSAAGLIVGYYMDANSQQHIFTLSADRKTFTAFDPPKSSVYFGSPVAVNDQGEVLFSMYDYTSSGVVRSADGSTYTKVFGPGASTIPGGINNNGEVVGWVLVDGSYSARHGFLRSADGTVHRVDLPGTLEGTFLVGINNRGQMLVSNPSGYILNADGSSLSLDPVLAQWPKGINDYGVVAGMLYPAGSRGFVAVPTAVKQPVIRSVMGLQSPAAFGALIAVVTGSWIEIYGANLAPRTRQWAAADFSGNTAPTSLDGVRVTINGRDAFLSYISPGQINANAPDVTPGAAVVTVTNGAQVSAPYKTYAGETGPGLLLTAADQIRDDVLVFKSDGTFAQTVKAGETIILYGIGFGPTTPYVPTGQIATQPDKLQGLFEATFSIGGLPESGVVSYAGHVPGTVGLYQFNMVVPDMHLPNGAPSYHLVLTCRFNGRDVTSLFRTGNLSVVP